MSEPESPIPDASNDTATNNIVAGLETTRTDQEPSTQNKNNASESGQNIENSRTQRIKNAIYIWFGKLRKAEPDRQAELVIALVIALFAVVQWHTVSVNNDTATQQTSQLIASARISAQAAKDNVFASRNFAESARGINQGVENAVGRLAAQANATEAARETSEAASAAALRTTIDNFRQDERPWVNSTIQITKQEITAWSTYGVWLNITLKNYGKTPASNVAIGVDTVTFAIPNPSMWENSPACSDADRNSISRNSSDLVFPGNELRKPYGVEFRRDETQVGTIPKMLIVCVAYLWNATKTTYHTRTVYVDDQAPDSRPIPCPQRPALLCSPIEKFEQWHADEWQTKR